MKRKHLAVIAVLGISTLLSSCAKEGPNGPTGPAGPTFTGSISGHVTLFDEYGSRVLVGLNNVKISLDNSAAISPDATGAYSYPGIVTGMYTIAATDSAYAATMSNFNFVSGTLNKDIKLSAIPDSFITSFTTYQNSGSTNDSLVLTFTANSRTRNCIIFANTTPVVSSQPSNYLWYRILSVSPTAPTVAITVPRQDLTDVGMTTGNKVYYAAYSYVVGDVSVYEDVTTTGRNVYNAVNANPIIDSTLVP